LAPLLALFAWIATDFAAAKRHLIEQQRLVVTHRVSAAVDQEIAGYIGMLTGLAAADDLVRRKISDFQRQATIIGGQPDVNSIWAFSKDGKLVPGTVAPPNSVEPALLDSEVVSRVFSSQNAVSGVSGEGLERATFVVAVPVLHSKRVAYGLAAEIKVVQLSRLFAEAGMEKDWAAAVVDYGGSYVARSLDADRRIGQLARPELRLAARATAATGIFENVTYENVPMLNAYYRSSLTGWTTVVAVPRAELAAPLRRAATLVLVGGGTILLATLGLATFLSARISEPVRSLSQFANALATGQPYRESAHHVVELDEVRAALERTITQTSHLSALVASSGDAIVSMDLDGTIKSWNKGAQDLFGYTAEEVVGKPKTVIVPKERLSEFEAQLAHVLSGQSIRAETVRRKRDGSLVHVSLDSAPICRPDGTVIAISSIIHDITERRVAEEHKELLMRELTHRSKNQLAIIQSIAGQTARTEQNLDDFVTSFSQRLQGLAASHDLLTSRHWKGAFLADVVRQQLEAFAGGDEDRLDVSGPEVLLGTSAAEAVGLALHELATNSVKYGALSAPSGRVTLTWGLRANGSKQRRLHLDWIEIGGPPVHQPSSKGFGSHVIERLVATVVDGDAEIHYRPEGVRWHLECPVNNTDGDLPTVGK
jgi:PAS domain S-box-containing protein